MKTAIFSCLLLFAGIVCAAAEPLNVYCTTFPLYLLTRNLTQGCRNVHTELIIPPGTGCPHDYALTPRDMRKLGAKNMVLVRNGLGLDDFILKPLRKMNPGAKIIDTSAGIPALELEEKCGHDDCHEHHHGSKNPHLFASPFEAVSHNDKALMLTGVGSDDAKLVQRAVVASDIARIMNRFSVLIVERKHDRDNIDSTAVVSNDELKKIEAPEDLTELVASRGTKK